MLSNIPSSSMTQGDAAADIVQISQLRIASHTDQAAALDAGAQSIAELAHAQDNEDEKTTLSHSYRAAMARVEAETNVPAGDSKPGRTSHSPHTPDTSRDSARIAVFDAFLASTAGKLALETKHKTSSNSDGTSINAIVSKAAVEQIVKNPREYQLELFERAKEQNTICVLDTGSGKTLIAVLLLRWAIDQELEARAAGKQCRVSFFLCCSVALTFQQFSVLETNLDDTILRLCGHDNPDRFDKSTWAKIFAETKVIVCTPDILVKCLSRGFISMRQINLLIFDEAHHAKKNHPYARIIKDYYRTVDKASLTERPRIFGMTASPVDSKDDPVEAAFQLETLLDCRIATASDMTLVDACKPEEKVLNYDPPPAVEFESAFLHDLRERYSHIPAFDRCFARSAEIARQLGQWCSDHYLLDAFSDEKAYKYDASIRKSYPEQANRARNSKSDEAVAEMQSALKHIQDEGKRIHELNTAELCQVLGKLHHNGPSHETQWRSRLVTPKVVALHKYLSKEFECATANLCMVFVEWKSTARLLHRLFQVIGTKFMTSEYVVGSTSISTSEEAMFTLRSQVLSLAEFRNPESAVNCLFATSVAEEGLDVPECNVVIRFDIYKTMIQYVQSRGRARAKESRFIHMMEKDNGVHAALLREVFYGSKNMKEFCAKLPKDRQLQGNMDMEKLAEGEENVRTYVVKSSGARLTYGTAMQVLSKFVSAIPSDTSQQQSAPRPTYSYTRTALGFVSEVILPANAPIRSAVGLPRPRITVAKHSAAFQACLILLQKKYLDENLLPIYQKRLPAMRNALLADGMNISNRYTMLSKPGVWAKGRGTFPTELWVTTIDFVDGQLERSHQPILFLTRTAMPSFPHFSVFLTDGKAVTVSSQSLLDRGPSPVSKDLLQKLTKFTLCVFRDIFSKEYEDDAAKCSYWLCPARKYSTYDHSATAAFSLIDESMLDIVASDPRGLHWTSEMSSDLLLGKFLLDPWDDRRKWFSTEIHPTLTPADPVPADAFKCKHNNTILDYSVSLSKDARKRAMATYSKDQPVIVAERSMYISRRNMLEAPNQEEKDLGARTKAYLCAEPLRVSVLPPKLATTLFVWPAIIHRFEAYLISLEGCSVVGAECDVENALAAFSKYPGIEGPTEHGEKLEFLGDTFLKVATSLSTFVLYPDMTEFDAHVGRMLMLCNKNLYNHAVSDDRRMYQYIRSLAFSRRLWYPEGLKMIKGRGVKAGEATEMYHEKQTHSLCQKSIADVCEAIIGACLVHANKHRNWTMHSWDDVVAVVSNLVRSKDHPMRSWNDYRDTYNKHIPAYQIAEVGAVHQELAHKLATENAYTFRYPRLAFTAFIHPSVPWATENYQRLEWLGDSLIDLAAVQFMFYRHPDKDPQWQTEHKSAMVSNRFLGSVAVQLGFHKHLRHREAQLESQIRSYVTALNEAKAKAEAISHQNPSGLRDYWTTVKEDPPKCLPDIVEAYVGAMFVDSDFDFSTVQCFFDDHMRFHFEDLTIYDHYASDHPITKLDNLLSTSFGCRDHKIVIRGYPGGEDGRRKSVAAGLVVHDKVVDSAVTEGDSPRYAKVRVAVKAEKVFACMDPAQFREEWGCRCNLKAA